MPPSTSTSVVSFGTGAKLIERMSAPTMTSDRTPPRLSTGSVVSLTWPGTKRYAIRIATTASGSVTRNTDPQSNCSSSAPEISGPSAAIAPPIADHSAIDFVRAGPRPERCDQRQRRRIRHPRCQAAAHARDEQHLVGRRERGEQRHRDGEHRAEQEHELSAVAVADRAEVEDRRGEPERVADGDEVERHLAGVEVQRDVGQRDVGDREVEVRDSGDEDQRDEDDAGAVGRGRFVVSHARIESHAGVESRFWPRSSHSSQLCCSRSPPRFSRKAR